LSVPSNGPTNQFDGNIVAPYLVRDNTERVQGIRILGIDREYAPITNGRLRQSTESLVLAALTQELPGVHRNNGSDGLFGGAARRPSGVGALLFAAHQCPTCKTTISLRFMAG
jgi:hypothetical protein